MPDNQTIADIILRWIVDRKSQSDAEKALRSIEKSIAGSGKSARGASTDWRAYSDVLGKSEAEINAVASALNGTGKEAVKASETLGEWNQQLLQATSKTEDASKATQKFSGLLTGVGGFTLIRLGRELDRAGKSILSPISAFVDAAGETSAVGARWLDATEKIEDSTVRIGAVMATQLLPTLEKAAELADKVATLIEQNPELAKAAAFIGVGAIGLGGLVTTIGDLITTIAGLKILGVLPKGGLAGLAGGEGAAVGGLGAAGGLGLGAGAAAFIGSFKLAEFIRENLGDPIANLFTSLTPLLGPAGPLISAATNLERLIAGIKELAGVTEEAAPKVEQPRVAQSVIDAYINFVKQQNEAEQQYMTERQSIIDAGLKQISSIESTYASQRTQIIETYNRQRDNALENFNIQRTFAEAQFELSQQRALEDYYNRRKELAKSYRENVHKAEEEHQRRIRQLLREHNDRVMDLVAARDALGLVRERRDFERKRQDEEENYRAEARQRNRDFGSKIDQMEQQFRIEQARRAQDFAIRQEQEQQRFALQQQQAAEQLQVRLKQLEEEHKAEMEQARLATRDKLAALQQDYYQERIQRRNAFLDQLRDIQGTLLYERDTRLAYYKAMEADLVAWLARMGGTFGSNLPGYPTETHQKGGYGPGYIGPGEYAMTRSTTNMLEQLAGNKLTQQGILGMMNGGTTINFMLPAGIVTMKTLTNVLEANNVKFLKNMERALI